ncbi:unnamed protein product, partial [Brassica oleracea]
LTAKIPPHWRRFNWLNLRRKAHSSNRKPQDEDAENEHRTTPLPRTGPICLTDASWHKDDTLFGGGMVLMTEDGTTTY